MTQRWGAPDPGPIERSPDRAERCACGGTIRLDREPPGGWTTTMLDHAIEFAVREHQATLRHVAYMDPSWDPS